MEKLIGFDEYGATMVIAYLLHKLGGQVHIDPVELKRVASTIADIPYQVDRTGVTVKLVLKDAAETK